MAQTAEIGLALEPGPDGTPAPAGEIDRATFTIENMNCGGCMRAIEKTVLALDGVKSARANLSAKRLTIELDDGLLGHDDVIEALEGAGFRAGELVATLDADRSDRDLLRRVAVAGFAAANIMLLSVSVWAGAVSDMDSATGQLFHWISALIALPTVVYAGQPFFISALDALRGWRLNMDVPISLAIILASGLSLHQTFTGADQVYFDAAVTLLFFLLIGRYLDRRMRIRAQGAAQNLLGLQATRATVISDNASPRRLPAHDVMAGDRVLVAAGERVPVDGVVVAGKSDVDQSLITGETRVHSLDIGATVFAGTVNLTGPIEIDVTAAQDSTLLAELARLMEAAEQGKGRYVLLADRAAQIYAPAVHALGALTFVGWMLAGAGWETALVTAIAVLIITCPCALALAVPSVQVAAAARLFGRGVVLKSGDGLERLAEIDSVLFDKTGTLTLGRPELLNGQNIDDVTLGRAAALAATSRHPYSRAITRAAELRGIAVRPSQMVTEHPGAGLVSSEAGHEERLGSASWCGIPEATSDIATLYYRVGQDAPVAFKLSDPLRPDAKLVAEALQSAGYAVGIISGDRSAAVEDAGRTLDIEQTLADTKPDAKIAHLTALGQAGHKVLMVGDGLNDAPSLAAAHASLSPSTAAEISQQASDAVFQGDALAPVLEAIVVARAAKRMALQNFALAAAYNAVCIPLAAAGLVTPADCSHRHVDLFDHRHGQRIAPQKRQTRAWPMTALAWLIPAALGLGLVGLAAFLWALKSGQFEDLDGAAYRAIENDETPDD